jgi:hypothetical protein
MLERKEFIYETNKYKIKIPTKSEMKNIYDEIVKLTEDGDVAIDNDVVLFYLFKEVVIPIDENYNFNKYSIAQFIKVISDNITQYDEMNEMQFYVSKILSQIMTESYREMLLQIEEAKMKIEKSKCEQAVIELQETMVKTETDKNKEKEEERVEKILNERNFEKQELPKLNFIEKYKMKRKLLKDYENGKIK